MKRPAGFFITYINTYIRRECCYLHRSCPILFAALWCKANQEVVAKECDDKAL